MTRLTGDALRAWVQKELKRYACDDRSLELLLIEAYLQGAVDALKEEVTFLQERGPNVGRER